MLGHGCTGITVLYSFDMSKLVSGCNLRQRTLCDLLLCGFGVRAPGLGVAATEWCVLVKLVLTCTVSPGAVLCGCDRGPVVLSGIRWWTSRRADRSMYSCASSLQGRILL